MFNINVFFANGLLIVKENALSEEISFYSKLTGKIYGFDLQAAVKNPSLPRFRQASPFATVHLFAKWVNFHSESSTYWKENHIYLVLLSAIPACISSGCIIIDCFLVLPQLASFRQLFLVQDWVLAVKDDVSNKMNTYLWNNS